MNCPNQKSKRLARCQGMTLVELMIAFTISVVVLGISTAFLIEATRATLKVQSNSQNDLTEWGIYAGITIDTRIANGMTIYKDFNPASFDSVNDRITLNTTRGDFMVLSQSIQEAESKKPSYSSLTGYLFTPGATANTGIFKKFTYAVPSAEKNNSLETIISDHYTQFVFKTIAKGLDATHSDGATVNPANRAFLYRSDRLRSGVLNLQVASGYTGARTQNYKLIETAFYIRN